MWGGGGNSKKKLNSVRIQAGSKPTRRHRMQLAVSYLSGVMGAERTRMNGRLQDWVRSSACVLLRSCPATSAAHGLSRQLQAVACVHWHCRYTVERVASRAIDITPCRLSHVYRQFDECFLQQVSNSHTCGPLRNCYCHSADLYMCNDVKSV